MPWHLMVQIIRLVHRDCSFFRRIVDNRIVIRAANCFFRHPSESSNNAVANKAGLISSFSHSFIKSANNFVSIDVIFTKQDFMSVCTSWKQSEPIVCSNYTSELSALSSPWHLALTCEPIACIVLVND